MAVVACAYRVCPHMRTSKLHIFRLQAHACLCTGQARQETHHAVEQKVGCMHPLKLIVDPRYRMQHNVCDPADNNRRSLCESSGQETIIRRRSPSYLSETDKSIIESTFSQAGDGCQKSKMHALTPMAYHISRKPWTPVDMGEETRHTCTICSSRR